MNTKNVARRMASKFQRSLLAMLIVITLLGSFPVGRAHAATGGVISFVNCERGYYKYSVAVNGAYPNQYVAIRYLQDTLQNGIWTRVTGGWTYVYAKGPYTNIVEGPVYVRSGAVVKVSTEVWYWNSLTRMYERAVPIPAHHYNYFDNGPFGACQIY